MGTKSHIAIERENGAVESIRCQYDGYPAYNGALLLQHYNTPDRVNALIGPGNITYLAEELEPTGVHSFEEPQEGVTLAYGRDRGAENLVLVSMLQGPFFVLTMLSFIEV
ncbi:MAG: hypothetical protein IJB00_01320 [Akkermansia sp.]|nr:hypothetical protein [Akkermansia sp.]